MKKILLSIGFGTLAIFASAQTVFNVDAPSSIGGSYDFEYADTAGTGGSTWGVFDLTNPINAVVDTLVLVDAIDTTVAGELYDDSTFGCASLNNAADLVGKIAVVFRGDCQFGFKAKNAQDAGAVGVIIINNIPGNPLGMLAGDDGAFVTIPTVMVSDITGATLVSTMATDDVVVFIGNKSGRFPNDLSIDENEVVRPKETAVVEALAQNASELEVLAGAWIRNYGFNTQHSVELSYNISFGGSSVYSNFSIVDSLETGDSVYVTLPTFSQATYPAGEYDMNYSVISDSVESFPSDNMVNSKMLVNSTYLSVGTVEASTGLPTVPADTYYWFSKTCMSFSHPFASRIAVRGITFSATSTRDDVLTGKFLETRAYEWDGSDPSSMSDIAAGEYDYNSDLSEENVTVEFNQPFKLNDFQNYLFCVENTTSDTVYIGTSNIGYGEGFDNYGTYHSIVEQTDGTRSSFIDIAPAISIETFDGDAVSINEEVEESLTAYPNPARNMISIPVGNLEISSVVIYDVTGKIVSTQDVSSTSNNLTLDVTSIPNGMYIVALNKADNTTSKINVVISK
jgi:hypothetical protein